MNFLTAEWRKIAIFNFEVAPDLLEKYLPDGVELDFYNDKCYVSLIGFLFLNTKLLGFPIPLHTQFEEVNLRFYVKKETANGVQRGVVFIKELVPKKALSLVANSIYKENYHTKKMSHIIKVDSISKSLYVEYCWFDKFANSIKIRADNTALKLIPNSEFEFITEHYYGFTKIESKTSQYEVIHPQWDFYQVKDYEIKVDFKMNYGADFQFLNDKNPSSVFLAEGSPIKVKTKQKL